LVEVRYKSGGTGLARTLALIERGGDEGLHIGAQLYVSRRGTPVADVALGESRPGVAMASDSLMLWLSSGKPIAAAAMLQLRDRQLCDHDEPVQRYLPQFGANGKQAVTIRHLLTHTGGFRWVDTGWPQTTWDEIIARICAAKLERGWVPGQRAGYHPYTSWYILGELVRRIDGRPFARYVRDEIFEPLGMHDSWIGMPTDRFRQYGARVGQMQNTERPGHAPHQWSSEAGILHCAPGGNAHGPIRELGYFYEMLVSGGQRRGVRVLEPASVEEMTSPQRTGMFDETFQHVIDWGLGLILDSKQYDDEPLPYGYGPYSSPRTYGHGGSQSSVGFADPESELVAAIVFNGMPGEARHQARIRAVLSALYEDLRLA
jgi:CubicO group peptidase (beta-lactamase class C family)